MKKSFITLGSGLLQKGLILLIIPIRKKVGSRGGFAQVIYCKSAKSLSSQISHIMRKPVYAIC